MNDEQDLFLIIFHYSVLGIVTIDGFQIFTDEELRFFLMIWRDGFYRQKNGYEFDNQVYIQWCDFDSFMCNLKIAKITSDEADFLDLVFKLRQGQFPHQPKFEAF